MVIMWIWRCFDRLKCHGVTLPIEGRMLIQNNVTAARGGVGATLGMIGCPYPFAYVHIIYWVVQVSSCCTIRTALNMALQIYLFILSVETGVQLAIYTKRLGNGGLSELLKSHSFSLVGYVADGSYSADDNNYHFPENGYIWYFNTMIQITVQNVVFALFTQGS
jgi:hypothetical protein